ncbi:MAG: hypothetical protein IIC71_14340 [Acidobacteria bacterium]|nr:hypothetical protein [Acidobacteriota bacterium]
MQRILDSSEWSLPPRMRSIGRLFSATLMAGALGCTNLAVTAMRHHTIEGSATIKFKTMRSTSLVDDVSAQEFGHYLRLGHSDISWVPMSKSAFQGAVSLSGPDRAGRCQIYGHAHGWWGGC